MLGDAEEGDEDVRCILNPDKLSSNYSHLVGDKPLEEQLDSVAEDSGDIGTEFYPFQDETNDENTFGEFQDADADSSEHSEDETVFSCSLDSAVLKQTTISIPPLDDGL